MTSPLTADDVLSRVAQLVRFATEGRHRLDVSCVGSEVRAYIDGELVLDEAYST